MSSQHHATLCNAHTRRRIATPQPTKRLSPTALSNATMRAVQCNRFAALDASGKVASTISPIRDVLSLKDAPSPTLHNSEKDRNKVLISTHYAGIQYPDFLQAQGLYQIKPQVPYTPGMDVAGIVIDKGSNVPDDQIQVGDRVYGKDSDVDQTQVGDHVYGITLSRCKSNALVYPK